MTPILAFLALIGLLLFLGIGLPERRPHRQAARPPRR
jgi:hypothetical protein